MVGNTFITAYLETYLRFLSYMFPHIQHVGHRAYGNRLVINLTRLYISCLSNLDFYVAEEICMMSCTLL